MSQLLSPPIKTSLQFWMLCFFLVIVFATGGGSRSDVQSLLVLRPTSAVACALALLTLRWQHLAAHRVVSVMMAAIILLSALHLVPLPPALWQQLPGREILVEIDRAVGLNGIWRPLTMTPMNAYHSLLSLLTPLAVLLFAVQLNREELFRLLLVLLVLGGTSGLLGILQVVGSPTGPLYFYRITNNGSAVGLFANRNHAAVLLACMFPLLAVFASTASSSETKQKYRQVITVSALILLVPLILVTGSRSGFFVGLIGMLSFPMLYMRPAPARVARRGGIRWRVGPAPILGAVGILCLGLMTAVFSRAEALSRVFGQSPGEDTRTQYWEISIALVADYMPWGSGLGSFVETYQIAEPLEVLNRLYVNHAHNDWIEIALTMGIPGILLIVAAVFLVGMRTLRIWRAGRSPSREVLFARMASIVIGMVALASITDYPLRTPIFMSLFIVFAIWLFMAETTTAGRGERSGLGAELQ